MKARSIPYVVAVAVHMSSSSEVVGTFDFPYLKNITYQTNKLAIASKFADSIFGYNSSETIQKVRFF